MIQHVTMKSADELLIELDRAKATLAGPLTSEQLARQELWERFMVAIMAGLAPQLDDVASGQPAWLAQRATQLTHAAMRECDLWKQEMIALNKLAESRTP